jgi:hypothetical protein
VCTIPPAVESTVGRLLGPFVFPPQPSPMYIYHYSSSFLHQRFLTYQLGPKNGKTHHWEWVAIILINKLKFPTIQAKFSIWYDGLTCTDSITYIMMQAHGIFTIYRANRHERKFSVCQAAATTITAK